MSMSSVPCSRSAFCPVTCFLQGTRPERCLERHGMVGTPCLDCQGLYGEAPGRLQGGWAGTFQRFGKSKFLGEVMPASPSLEGGSAMRRMLTLSAVALFLIPIAVTAAGQE